MGTSFAILNDLEVSVKTVHDSKLRVTVRPDCCDREAIDWAANGRLR